MKLMLRKFWLKFYLIYSTILEIIIYNYRPANKSQSLKEIFFKNKKYIFMHDEKTAMKKFSKQSEVNDMIV